MYRSEASDLITSESWSRDELWVLFLSLYLRLFPLSPDRTCHELAAGTLVHTSRFTISLSTLSA